MAYLTFDAPRGSQQGLDIASAMLQQRMGGGSPLGGQDMSLMYRRDPRAAAALIQAQLAAQEAAADRAQRGDIAGQEMGYRNRALDAQMQESGMDRQASMDRLVASLAGQRGLAGERMNFDREQADAARRAAIGEAEAMRAFQRGQTQQQIAASQTEGEKGRQHQTGLAAMQAALQAASQQAEQAGLDARARMDMQGRIMGAFAEAAASQDPAAWQTVQSRIPEIMRSIAPQGVAGSATPVMPTPEPKTVAGKLASKEPELTAAWTSLMGGRDDKPRKSATELLLAIPTEDIENNPKAVKQFLEANYDTSAEDALWSYGGGLPTRKAIEARRRALGLKPMNPNLIWRLFGVHGTEGKDSTYGFGF